MESLSFDVDKCIGRKIGPGILGRNRIPWKDPIPSHEDPLVPLLRTGYPVTIKIPWGIKIVNRVVSVAIAAAMALSMAGVVQAAGEMKPKKEPTPAQAAARERMAKCSRNGRTPRPAGSSRKMPTGRSSGAPATPGSRPRRRRRALQLCLYPGAASAEPGIHIR